MLWVQVLPGPFCVRGRRGNFSEVYIDPPYHGHEEDYGKGMFTRAEFEELAELLGTLKGSFILSINDTPEIRKTFAGMRWR